MGKQQFWDGASWVDESPQAPRHGPSTAATVTRHVTGRLTEALVVVGIVGALAFGSAAFGGAPVGANLARAASTVTISVPNASFAGTTVATVDPPPVAAWVDARCYQGGTLVFEQWVQTNSLDQATLTLGPTSLWTAGGASCTATANALQRGGRMKTLASTTFSVVP